METPTLSKELIKDQPGAVPKVVRKLRSTSRLAKMQVIAALMAGKQRAKSDRGGISVGNWRTRLPLRNWMRGNQPGCVNQ
jgi:hypothetical protein